MGSPGERRGSSSCVLSEGTEPCVYQNGCRQPLGFWDSRILLSTLGCCGPYLEGRDLRLGGEVGQTPQISRANFKGARFGGPAQECAGQAGWLRSPSHGMLA